MTALSTEIADWVSRLSCDDLPGDVVRDTRLRVLDVIGLCLAGADTAFGRSVRNAAVAMFPEGPCRVLGTGERLGVTAAPFVNAAAAQALEYDDTHVESIVHMSSPAVAAALALSETSHASGRDVIAAVALGNEISCRVGSVSPGELHKRGFHPTGLFAPFGVAYLAGKMLGLDRPAMSAAAGIVGSFAAGILECWVDGTESKFLHSGWAAQSGIAAAFLAREGATGPPAVLEGRFGLFASHVQDPDARRDLDRAARGLGREWESRNAAFKPFPAAHVLHPYIDALLRLCRDGGIEASDVAAIDCPVAEYIVPIVCEPVAEKQAPRTGAHGRVCLQYTLDEALHFGELGREAYRDESVRNPEILGLARRVRYHVDPGYPGPGRFKGAVTVTTKDGRRLEAVEEFSRGSRENPMREDAILAKFEDNAGARLSAAARRRLIDAVLGLERLEDAGALAGMTVGDR